MNPGAFLDLPAKFSDPLRSKAVIVPVPYDGTSTFGKGADRGPQALIEASAALEDYDIETGWEPHVLGITTRSPVAHHGSPEALADLLEPVVAEILVEERLPVVLGGDHSVSIGAMRTAADHYPGLSFLQIDAHSDTREEYEGSPYNHACVMARARELGPISQVGIRSLDRSELDTLDPQRIWYAHRIVGDTQRRWIDEVVASLSDQVYLTIDLDAFDPSLVPATGTPEPGGLGWYDVIQLIDALARRKKVVAFDVVELCPIPGHRTSEFIAAKLVHRTLAAVLQHDSG